MQPLPLLRNRSPRGSSPLPGYLLSLHKLCPGVPPPASADPGRPGHATQPVHWQEEQSPHSSSDKKALHSGASGNPCPVASLPFLSPRMSPCDRTQPREVPASTADNGNRAQEGQLKKEAQGTKGSCRVGVK